MAVLASPLRYAAHNHPTDVEAAAVVDTATVLAVGIPLVTDSPLGVLNLYASGGGPGGGSGGTKTFGFVA
jgi:hypothetical protein